MKFIHLHNHSENSLLDGVSTISEWAKRAKELGMNALSITDHGNLNGVQQLLFACKQEGIKPIVGMEAYIVPDRKTRDKKEYRNHLILLAKNTEGYHNLIRLVSEANLTGFYKKPRIDFRLLKKYSGGLIALSACIAGSPQTAIRKDDEELAISEMNKFQELFGDDYYMEIMLFPEKMFIDVYPKIVRIAQKQGVPLVLTNDCHYLYKKDSLLQSILFQLKSKSTFKDKGKKKKYNFTLKCLWMKSLQELLKTWKEYYSRSISLDALKESINNTVKIANKIEKYDIDKSNKYPAIFVGDKRVGEDQINDMMKMQVLAGWRNKGFSKENDPVYFKRLKYELGIILDKGMSAYFIILADVIRWAIKKNILVGFGRGCFTGDTRVSLLDGSSPTMKELSMKFKNKEFNVYSCLPNGKIVIGTAKNPRITKKVDKLCVVEIDSGKKIKCTVDHKFMLRSGSYVEARDLKSGDSLMPLYRKKDSKGYEKFYDNKKRSWFYTHYMNFIKKYKTIIHHIDFNKQNNCPNNLQQMEWKDHCELHGKTNSLMWRDPKWREDGIKRYWRILGSKENRRKTSERNKMSISRMGKDPYNKGKKLLNEKYVNHKVKTITFIHKSCDMYDIEVNHYHNFALKNGVFVHNSVAGCLLAYLLGIHNVDPIKHRLLFERFINKSSDSMPDIDVDFDARYREDIKKYIIDKYGSDKVSEIVTYGMMKIKSAIKDIARVYDFDYRFINDVTKKIDNTEELTRGGLSNIIGDWKNKDIIIDLAMRMQGHVRHMSIHPAGLVITPTALTDHLPLQRYKERIITGWTEGVYRREITSLGLVKYDILGLTTLSVIADCIEFVKKRHNKTIHLDKIPLDSDEVYKMYRDGNNIGIFQCDSHVMRGLIKKLKPKEFEDIVALLALDRPAPLSIGVFDKFLIYRKNKDTYKQFHPVVWEILKDTHGVLLYQEQVLNLTKVLAKFTTEQRLVMKKLLKKPPKGKAEHESFLQKQKELGKVFIERASKTLEEHKAIELWSDIKAFGAYGFNKSHSCSYALLTNATMWLKTYYPIEFYAALLNHSNDEKIDAYRTEIQQEGIKLLKADINKSQSDFVIEGKNIRYGISKLKGIGKSVEVVLKKKYRSMEEFLLYALSHKKDINKRVILALIKSGAFDDLCTRGEALHLYRKRSDRKYIGSCEKLNDFQMLEGEREVYGFYFSGDMKSLINSYCKGQKYMELDQALRQKAGTKVRTYAKVERVNATPKALFINIVACGIKTAIIGFREAFHFKDKFKQGDIIIVEAERMDYKGKKELIIKEFSKIEKIGG